MLQRRVGVRHELLELRGEPGAGERRVGQRAGQVVAVAGVAGVGRVAHPVEALALVVRDRSAGAVGLARRLDPDVGVDAGGRAGLRALAEAGAALVAPVAGVDAAVDAGAVDERCSRRSSVLGPVGPGGAAPAVAGGVDQHADVDCEAGRDQRGAERLGEGQLVDVLVPVDPLGLPDAWCRSPSW